VSGVYSMTGPTYSGLSKLDLLDSAMSQPLSLTSTLFEEGKGGALESFGLGTLLRRGSLPEEAPVQEGTDANGNAIVGTGDVYVPPDVGMRDALMGTWGDTPTQLEQRRQAAGALTEDQYKQSPSFRKDIPYDPGMTETRAAALAEMDDVKKVREFYAQKRPLAAFLGGMAGQALDPINYVPVGGPLVKAAAIGRFGKIGGEALAASLDAAANTALFGIGTADARAALGDDVSWQALISQIATAGLIGSAFGTVAGAIGRRMDARVSEAEQRLSTLKTTQEARIALNEGIDAIVRGEDVNLSPNATEPLQRVANDVGRAYVPPVETPEFRDWFAGSKVVANDGTPLVVYHGTGANIDAFRLPELGTESTDAGKLGRGVYFSARPDIASFYAERSKISRDAGPNVMPVYLSIKNPLEFEAGKGGDIWTKLRDQSKQWGIELDPVKETDGNTPNDAWAHAFTEAAKEHGHDGIALKFSDGGHEFVAFDPGQIKSKFNTGAFNSSDARVIDTTKPRLEPPPDGITQAAASITKPEDTKALAAQYGIDANTGSFKEEAEIAQLADEGRLTEQDVQNLAQAHADFETADAYAEALKSVAGCLI
jgi:hypothetical protein